MVVELHLPMPPSSNALWEPFINRSKGRVFADLRRTAEYKAWLIEAGYKLNTQHPPKIAGPYKIQIQAVRPQASRLDLGNIEKATSDLIVAHGVVDDDCKAEMISLRWVTVGEGVYVLLSPAGVE